MTGFGAGLALLGGLWLAYNFRPRYGATLAVIVVIGVLVYQTRNGKGIGAWVR